MKRTIALGLVAAITVYSAFAEVGVGMWGRGCADMLQVKDNICTVQAGPDWAPGARVGLNTWGDNGSFGFNLQMFCNGYAGASGAANRKPGMIYIGDNAKIWGNLGPVTLTLGRYNEDDLTGGYGDYGLFGGLGLGYTLFSGFNSLAGVHMDLHLGNFFAATAVNLYDENGNALDAASTYSKIQVACAYTVDNVGRIKVQYLGDEKKLGTFEAGFDLYAFDSFGTQVGCKIRPAKAFKDEMLVVALGANYDGVVDVAVKAAYFSVEKLKLDTGIDFTYEINERFALIETNIIHFNENVSYDGQAMVKANFGSGPGFACTGVAFKYDEGASLRIPLGVELSF